ncbi:MAG: DNA repair exonuclease, partial [Deltaproteobacteria bacterium]|nr:DNA repair exonuclease [Deltaproteobacteria bacterium]
MKFIHTSDLHIGRPFAGIADERKRILVQQERLEVLDRIGHLAVREEAAFILVAGDLFDSPTVDKATVSAALARIGSLGVPVLTIPGNHDHGGPGSVWEQEFFRRERRDLAPNLRVLAESGPAEVAGASVFPCPLARRMETRDTLEWLRSGEDLARFDGPRIILAHGSVHGFGGDDGEASDYAANRLDLSRLPAGEYD